MIEAGSASAGAAADRTPGARPRRRVAEAFGRLRRRLPFSRRRVTDGAVRLPTIMTFVVAMFAATMGLVSDDLKRVMEMPGYTADNLSRAKERYVASGAMPDNTRYGWVRTS